MTKITLSDVSNILGNPTSAANTINANNDVIVAALDLLVSRDGETPNQMLADQDLNHNDLLNVGTVNADSLVLNGEVVTPDELATVPPTIMLKSVYDPQGKNADAFARANHTGTQAISTVTNLQNNLDKIERKLVFHFGAVGDGTTDDTTAVNNAAASGQIVDGEGLTYLVTAVPDLSLFRRASFKLNQVRHITKDFLRSDTSKISDGFVYTAWAEDSAYLIEDHLRVWVMEKESHADGTGRILAYFSDDGGSTWSPGEYLDATASGRTVWSAGYNAATSTEYVIVRVPAGATDVPPYTYERWHRVLTPGAGTMDLNTLAWTVTAITFPTPSGFTGQPVMVISFTPGHSGSIVVGGSYTEGAAAHRSTDGGATWSSFILHASTSSEEPTIKYDSTTQRYYGFIRNGSGANPRYFFSGVNDLSTISVFTAPSGTFGTNPMDDSPVPFVIKDGVIHAFGSYRSGTQEGQATDELTSAFYITFPVVAGNPWPLSTTKIYKLGTLPHREGAGAASAVGVGAVIAHEDKIHLLYGMEQRTGATASLNRLADIYQTVVFLEDRGGMFDFRNDLVQSRSTGPFRRMPKNQGLALYLGDGSGDYQATFSGRPNFARRNAQITIAAGVVTLVGRYGQYILDTEAAAAADDLDTLTDANAIPGDWVSLRTFSSARDITVKHATGNIRLNGQTDKLLSNAADRIVLEWDGSLWQQVTFSDNLV